MAGPKLRSEGSRQAQTWTDTQHLMLTLVTSAVQMCIWLLHFQLESTAALTRQSGSLFTDVFCLIIKLLRLWLAEGYIDPLWYKV